MYHEKIYYFKECSSTNDIAVDYLKNKKALEGTVILTDYQTLGRGQRGNTWISNKGENLLFSLILNPSLLSASQQFSINIIITIAIHKALQNLVDSEQLKIKWPNDIYYQNQKIGGILIENFIKKNQVKYSIIGVGLNANQNSFENLLQVSSLKRITQKEINLHYLLKAILKNIKIQYQTFFVQGISDMKHDYYKYLYRYQEIHNFKKKTNRNFTTFEGSILGVNEIGQLLVLIQNKIEHFSFKEIEFC